MPSATANDAAFRLVSELLLQDDIDTASKQVIPVNKDILSVWMPLILVKFKFIIYYN